MRSVLDHLLVQAAVEAGAELRERFRVDRLIVEDGRVIGVRSGGATERAKIVVGADGRRSTIARLAGAGLLRHEPVDGGGVFAYFEEVPVEGYEFHVRTGAWIGLAPSNDGFTHVATSSRFFTDGTPQSRFDRSIALVPSVQDRVRAGRRATRLVAYRDVPVYVHEASGPGWALVGDAGFNQGAYGGYGMSHAFRDAERLADAIDAWLSGRATGDEAMDAYTRDRDRWALAFCDVVIESLRAWSAGRQAPSEWPLVQRWLDELIARESALA
jgi:flavin-dependent dehydrogenase